MRLFVAIELPAAVKSEIGQRLERLRSEIPSASWTGADKLHLTVAFLGEQQQAEVPLITEALKQSVRGIDRFGLQLAGSGFFPNDRRPRVAWIGVDAPRQAEDAAAAVRSALESRSIPFDEKPFKPHLTVARMRQSWSAAEIARFHDELSNYRSSFIVDELLLFESKLSPRGATHSVKARLPLSSA